MQCVADVALTINEEASRHFTKRSNLHKGNQVQF